MHYNVIIIGGGPGGIFSAYELTKDRSDLRVAVFEAGHSLEKRHCPIDGDKVKSCIRCKSCSIMSGFGGAGAFSDGKYNITNDFGGTLHEYIGKKQALDLMHYVDEINMAYGGEGTKLYSTAGTKFKKLCMQNDLHLLDASVRHLGTDINYENERSFNSRWQAEEGDATYFLRNVADLFGSDDLTVVNMEGALTEGGERADKKFAFRGKPEYAKILSSASVEAATLANNHSQDYGQTGYDDTIAALDAEGVQSFGYDRIAYLDVKGVKVALIGSYFPEDSAENTKEMTDNIAAARAEGAQLVIVYVHWGQEHEYDITEGQQTAGRAAIDAGADLVVGSHPHVVQGWEVYQGRYIVYSLGNFCFGGNTNPDDKDCLIFQQTFTVTGDTVAKNDDVDFIAASVSTETDRNTYQPILAEGDEKVRIEAKVQEAADRIAAAA